jgi:DNA-binding transcriptional LysR family regulator
MDARHLSLLRELAERGSVSAVAAATYRTPSAVSQQLRTAERDLGVRLVEPDGRGIRLTDAGRLLADAGRDVDVALARAQGRLDDLRGRPTGTVRVRALPSAMEYLAPSLLTALADEPITLELVDDDVSEEDFAALTRDADLVIGHSLTGEVLRGAEDLARTVICREPIDVALPSGHRLVGRRTLTPDDVVGEPWIGVPVGFPFDTVLQAIEAATGRTADVLQRTRDNRVVAALVGAGHGIALLPRFTSRQDGVVLRPLRDVHSTRWVVAMARPDRAERAVVRRVVAELVRIGRDELAG